MSPITTTVPMQIPPHSSTPFRGVNQGPMNRTFDTSVGFHQPILVAAQDTATIAAEVSAAAAAQAVEGVLANVGTQNHQVAQMDILLMPNWYFWSWWADILANIQGRELDNKAAIQLIKEQMLDNACCEVEFQLDLCGGVITYQNLLRHLSVAFQGGDDEANLLAEFYSRGQKIKESEEAFADELQILARKVIIKKPDFRVNLDMTLKQCYVSQLLDHNSVHP